MSWRFRSAWNSAAALWAVLLVSIIVMGGCRDGSATVEDGISDTPMLSPVRIPTPVDTASFSLSEVAGQFDSYSIQVPVGWETEDIRMAGGFGRKYIMDQDGVKTVTLTVRCDVGATIEDMMWLDGQVVRGINGRYNPEEAEEVQIGALKGRKIDYTIPFATFGVDHRTYYFSYAPCGWRIDFLTLGQGAREHYAAFFERIVASFRPQEFQPPFEDRNPYLPSRQGNGPSSTPASP